MERKIIELKYYQSTFDLLKLKPRILESNVDLLKRQEKKLGRHIPESVIEWYSLEGSIDLMRKYSNDDYPEEVHSFKIIEIEEGEVISIMTENQAVCEWVLKIDDSKDPPVLVKVDGSLGHKGKWQIYSNHFSEFIYSIVFDHINQFYPTITAFSCEMMNEQEYTDIKKTFIEDLITYGWPSEIQLRFYNKERNQFILVWNKYECGNDLCSDWFFWGTTKEDLFKLLEIVLPYKRNLFEGLDAYKEDGEEILSKFKNKYPSGI